MVETSFLSEARIEMSERVLYERIMWQEKDGVIWLEHDLGDVS